MRVLLIAPPFYRLLGSHYNGLHLGIAYIAAVLKEHGHFVKIYNADYVGTTEYLDQKQLFENYPSYKTILYDSTNPIWSEIKENISGFAPDIVGITMLTANYKAAKIIANIVKSLNASIKVVVGSVHPTLDPEGILAGEDFDYAIRGEGEFAFLELADNREEDKIQGLSFKKGNRIIHNESRPFIDDLDILPHPCRDSFLNDTKNFDFGYLITGRGCPFSCAYCASPRLWQRKVRLRSISNVISELEYLHINYNDSIIHFADDTFTLNKHRAKEICQQIIDRRLRIKWVCDTRADCLDKELVALMKRAGCIRVKIGVESGSDRILKAMRKGVTKEQIRQAVGLIKGEVLPLTAYLMAGFPGETNEDLQQTIELARELDVDYYSLSIVAPYYGTKIWSDLEKAGNKPDQVYWDYFYHQSQGMLLNDDLDPALISQFWALNETPLGEKKRV
ncbi:B12-binding domain-containing radical SAM protein [Chloroflexota bacterium]